MFTSLYVFDSFCYCADSNYTKYDQQIIHTIRYIHLVNAANCNFPLGFNTVFKKKQEESHFQNFKVKVKLHIFIHTYLFKTSQFYV